MKGRYTVVSECAIQPFVLGLHRVLSMSLQLFFLFGFHPHTLDVSKWLRLTTKEPNHRIRVFQGSFCCDLKKKFL